MDMGAANSTYIFPQIELREKINKKWVAEADRRFSRPNWSKGLARQRVSTEDAMPHAA
jgi:hypothetical protein